MAQVTQNAYRGSCHCGGFQFKLQLQKPLETVFACRCIPCKKKSYLWVFPREEDFQITRGDKILASHRSADKSEHFVRKSYFNYQLSN